MLETRSYSNEIDFVKTLKTEYIIKKRRFSSNSTKFVTKVFNLMKHTFVSCSDAH